MYINKNYNLNKLNIINFFISVFPLSLIIGNTATNINIIIILILGFVINGVENFKIKNKIYRNLLLCFFFYLCCITFFKNYSYFAIDSIYFKNFLKSVFFLRFYLLFLVLNKLIEKHQINFRLLFLSFSFFSCLIALDIVIQMIFKKNLLGFEIIFNRPSSFFGDELIAGGYLQKFSIFFIFFIIYNYKKILPSNYFIIIGLLFIFFLIIISLTGNRMPFIIFCLSFLTYLFIEKKIKEIIFLLLLITGIILIFIKYPLINRMDVQIKNFYFAAKEMAIKGPKLFYENSNNHNLIISSGPTGYLVHFNSGVQIWKKNKLFGGGLKSFPLNCKYGNNQTCNSHPHNYFIEIMLDTGLVGILLIYTLIFLGTKSFLLSYNFKFYEKNKLIIIPFFLVIFFEFFPLRSTGSFFTTSNASVIFFILPFFLNFTKIKIHSNL